MRWGENLDGSLQTAAQNAALFVVDGEGKIQDASRRLVADGERRAFALQFSPEAVPRPQRLLLIAVAGSKRIQALHPERPTPAVDAFAAALRELQGQTGLLAVGAKYFRVQ